MTALTQFERLESGGLWRETLDAAPREVTVSFGKATLVLTDAQGQPLTHWSLPALIRMNGTERPAIFTPARDADETLEIDDDLMLDAIEQVRQAVVRAAPRHSHKGRYITLGLAALAIGAGILWAPGAMMRQTLSVVPESKRSEIGATILGHYQRLTGATCRNAMGRAPLTLLKNRLMGRDAKGQIVVVQTLPQGATILPGGIVLVDRALIEQHDDPAITAGYILAAIAGRESHDPLEDVLSAAGLQATGQLFTTGDLPNEILQDFAQTLQDTTVTPARPEDMQMAFDAAGVPLAPYAAIRDPDGTLLSEIADQGTPRLILSDSDWVRLQGICLS